mgnify:CR=1 FL=1
MLGVQIAACLCFINGAYGRQNPGTLGPRIHARLGCLLMESPEVLIPAGFFVWMRGWESPVMLAFFLIWQSHYVYRAWTYPLHLAKASSPMPVLLMLMGLAFNLVNGSLHGAWLFVHPLISVSEWLGGWQSIAGAVLFAVGMALNCDSSGR